MKVIALIGVLVAGYLWASTASHHDEQRQQNNYCAMVAQGAWPNFKNLDCEG